MTAESLFEAAKYVYDSDSVSTCAGSSVATMNASFSVELLVRLELPGS